MFRETYFFASVILTYGSGKYRQSQLLAPLPPNVKPQAGDIVFEMSEVFKELDSNDIPFVLSAGNDVKSQTGTIIDV